MAREKKKKKKKKEKKREKEMSKPEDSYHVKWKYLTSEFYVTFLFLIF